MTPTLFVEAMRYDTKNIYRQKKSARSLPISKSVKIPAFFLESISFLEHTNRNSLMPVRQ